MSTHPKATLLKRRTFVLVDVQLYTHHAKPRRSNSYLASPYNLARDEVPESHDVSDAIVFFVLPVVAVSQTLVAPEAAGAVQRPH